MPCSQDLAAEGKGLNSWILHELRRALEPGSKFCGSCGSTVGESPVLRALSLGLSGDGNCCAGQQQTSSK